MASNTEDIDDGFGMSFIDILACALGATIVLLLVFSKTLEFESSQGNTSSFGNSNGNMSNFSALELKNNLDGKMVSVRVVGIHYNSQLFSELIKKTSFGRWNYNRSFENHIEKTVHFGKNSVYFTLVSDTIMDPKLTFDINVDSKRRYLFNKTDYQISTKIIEGAAFENKVEVFSGTFEKGPIQLKNVALKDLLIKFEGGKTKTEDLIKIIEK